VTFLLGLVMVSLGLLIKPNFTPVLFALLVGWFWKPKDRQPLVVFLAIPLFALAFLAAALILPGGVSLENLLNFFGTAAPRAMEKVEAANNLSLVGFLHFLFPIPISPTITALAIAALLTLFGWVKRLDWRYWFLLPLIVSAITWKPYLALALPVQFALVGPSTPIRRFFLILAVGLIDVGRTGIGSLGILLLLGLVVRTGQAGGPGNK